MARGRPATILVVDDDALIAMSTGAMLEDLGHAAIEANSGEEALKILSDGTPIDLVMTDYAMPGMNGADLAMRIRKSHPDLPDSACHRLRRPARRADHRSAPAWQAL